MTPTDDEKVLSFHKLVDNYINDFCEYEKHGEEDAWMRSLSKCIVCLYRIGALQI